VLPCIEVFKAEGCSHEEYITIYGYDYHWTHKFARFLGGKDNKENLVPATAAANYHILEVVETFIAEKLLNKNNEAESSTHRYRSYSSLLARRI